VSEGVRDRPTISERTATCVQGHPRAVRERDAHVCVASNLNAAEVTRGLEARMQRALSISCMGPCRYDVSDVVVGVEDEAHAGVKDDSAEGVIRRGTAPRTGLTMLMLYRSWDMLGLGGARHMGRDNPYLSLQMLEGMGPVLDEPIQVRM
jgi:hypothetical protein